MRFVDGFEKKIMTIDQAKAIMHAWKITGKTVSFTNGCFDILHPGHLFSIAQAAKEADYLVVGLNSDASIIAVFNYGTDFLFVCLIKILF